MRRPENAAVLAIILILLAGVSFFAGQSFGNARTVTQTSTSIASQTTIRSISTVVVTTNPPPITSTLTSLLMSTITSTLTSTTTVTTSSSTTMNTGTGRSIPAFGNLQLTVSLNATSVKSGQGVKINVAMANALSSPNQVTSANRWPLVGLVDYACGTVYYPMGVEMLRGTNLSAASSSYLTLFHPGPQSCPNEPSSGIPSYVFKADSQLAIPENTGEYLSMNATLEVNGYWTWNGIDPNSAVHHFFEPGIYTLAAGDEWGDPVLLQVTVT